MGYNIHITRADDWLEAASNPIHKEDVDRLIAADPELQWSTDDWSSMRGPDGIVKIYDVILWNGKPVYTWEQSEIIVKSPNDPQVVKAVHIAQALGAKVIGDEGERYELITIFGKEELVTIDP